MEERRTIPVFTSGQNWSFPPYIRKKSVSRDIAMSLTAFAISSRYQHAAHRSHDEPARLFWIPEGMENREGIYAGYNAEELYAILTLESSRHRSIIIGEDLGMVPPKSAP
jgi:4-alpha-glucanotransferase